MRSREFCLKTTDAKNVLQSWKRMEDVQKVIVKISPVHVFIAQAWHIIIFFVLIPKWVHLLVDHQPVRNCEMLQRTGQLEMLAYPSI